MKRRAVLILIGAVCLGVCAIQGLAMWLRGE